MIAREFSTAVNYSKDDLVLYEGKLYVFTTTHSAGAWNAAQVQAVDSSNEIDLTRILSGVENATAASDYADTVVMAPSQIAGTRYKYILTNAKDPRE